MSKSGVSDYTDTHPVKFFVGVFLESLFGKYPEIANVSIALVLAPHKHLLLGKISFGILLLSGNAATVL